jgi:serine/threonine protein kinase
MITTIASALEAAAGSGPPEPHSAWRRAWQQLRADHQAGRHVEPYQLAGYLADVPAEDQKACACDLIAEHLRLYSRAGEPSLENYVAALAEDFPWLKEIATLPVELIEDEFLVRSTPPDGDYPRLANYRSRFPERPDVHERLARRCLASGRYVKLRVLGAGAMGIVYEAYDTAADCLVAIKEASLADPPAALRLASEIQHLRRLDHPGIVAIQDAGQSEDLAFYAMELVAGPSLASLAADYHGGRSYRSQGENQRQLRRLVEHVVQTCEAMAHAHERGILHRDLKPGNILIRANGEAVIIDWGLAQALLPLPSGEGRGVGECASEAAPIAGTPQYMAPEQAERQETAASDIFSLGATLYEVLTSRPPFDWGHNYLPLNWPEAIRQMRIEPPRRLVAGLPRPLDAICTKALARAPGDRYPAARNLAAALRQFLDSPSQPAGWLHRLGMRFC